MKENFRGLTEAVHADATSVHADASEAKRRMDRMESTLEILRKQNENFRKQNEILCKQTSLLMFPQSQSSLSVVASCFRDMVKEDMASRGVISESCSDKAFLGRIDSKHARRAGNHGRNRPELFTEQELLPSIQAICPEMDYTGFLILSALVLDRNDVQHAFPGPTRFDNYTRCYADCEPESLVPKLIKLVYPLVVEDRGRD